MARLLTPQPTVDLLEAVTNGKQAGRRQGLGEVCDIVSEEKTDENVWRVLGILNDEPSRIGVFCVDGVT